MSTVHSSSPGIVMASDHGPVHVIAMSHWAAGTVVAELKYREQLSSAGVVAWNVQVPDGSRCQTER
jgi:hypothetical protein